MKLRLIVCIIFFTNSVYLANAQDISSLEYLGHVIVPNNKELNNQRIGGLSAITFHPNGKFYLAADKPPSRIFQARINYTDHVTIEFDSVFLLSPPIISNSELEGIAYTKGSDTYYVADEQTKGTRIMTLDNSFNLIKLIQPVNDAFLPLSGHNSGIEGLTISNDEKELFYSFERPTKELLSDKLVKITRLSISNSNEKAFFYYKLHASIADKVGTNGISELLYINKSTLLVMERAYIPGLGNIVRLYKAYLPEVDSKQGGDNDSITILQTELLFDFGTTEGFMIDNAEGMTFNADKSLLIIVTDNNFNKRQQTQVIVLKVHG